MRLWKRSHGDGRHVGHQPVMKASLLGTLTSRHLLCSSLHGSSDPKTSIYGTGSQHTWSKRKTLTQHGKRRHQRTSMMWATHIYSKSCRCSCFSSGLGSPDHTPARPSHPEETGKGLTSRQIKLNSTCLRWPLSQHSLFSCYWLDPIIRQLICLARSLLWSRKMTCK